MSSSIIKHIVIYRIGTSPFVSTPISIQQQPNLLNMGRRTLIVDPVESFDEYQAIKASDRSKKNDSGNAGGESSGGPKNTGESSGGKTKSGGSQAGSSRAGGSRAGGSHAGSSRSGVSSFSSVSSGTGKGSCVSSFSTVSGGTSQDSGGTKKGTGAASSSGSRN
jgi:hypothetical protein